MASPIRSISIINDAGLPLAGVARSSQGNFDEAIKWFSQVADSSPRSNDAKFWVEEIQDTKVVEIDAAAFDQLPDFCPVLLDTT